MKLPCFSYKQLAPFYSRVLLSKNKTIYELDLQKIYVCTYRDEELIF